MKSLIRHREEKENYQLKVNLEIFAIEEYTEISVKMAFLS